MTAWGSPNVFLLRLASVSSGRESCGQVEEPLDDHVNDGMPLDLLGSVTEA